ncbi:MAG: hypothetical protein WCT14_14755, partial [Treponemataceae bacterium]
MRWKRVKPDDERTIRDFLMAREARCTAAASRFKELAACGLGSKAPGSAWAGFRIDEEGKAKACSLVIAMNSGVVSVVFDDAAHPANRRALARIISRRKISSFQGLAVDVALAENVRESLFTPFARSVVIDPVEYSLM